MIKNLVVIEKALTGFYKVIQYTCNEIAAAYSYLF
jgi:hypothetical protein